ncbi:cupredoxin domain-containing protein [Microvirga sp. GCM10011540]|uniref:cupredoxin domain-containing protein n=1 Tax=Microvirga sp. GCM10011540 TaxID=3317338 RepID=UPI0036112441
MRLLAGAGFLLTGLAATATEVSAQTPSPPVVSGEVATPVEITMNYVNGDVQCGPPRARLPARDPLELRVINRADRIITFAAPKFFAATQHIESAGFVVDLVKGGFTVAPQSTARVLLRTPAPGEYYFSCFEAEEIPDPQSSGFLIVVPAAR